MPLGPAGPQISGLDDEMLTLVGGRLHEFMPPEVSPVFPEVVDDLVELGLGQRAVVAPDPGRVAHRDLGFHLKQAKALSLPGLKRSAGAKASPLWTDNRSEFKIERMTF